MLTKIDANDIARAVEDLSMCEYFPREPGAQAGIMRLLAAMCPSREALDWLVDRMVNQIGRWHGPAELRGLLCYRFTPADGIEASCTLPGYSAADGEERTYTEHQQLKAEGWIAEGPGAEMVRRLSAAKKL